MFKYFRRLAISPQLGITARLSSSFYSTGNAPVNIVRHQIEPSIMKVPAERHVQAWIYDLNTRKTTGIAHLNASIYAAPIRVDIMHRVVVYTRALERGVVHYNQKSRADVSGSRRKMRPQKGMGMARVGDRRSPLFRGGGKAFAVKSRDFTIKLNKKIRDMGMRSALSSKYAQGQLYLVHQLGAAEEMADLRSKLDQQGLFKLNAKNLIVYGEKEDVSNHGKLPKGVQLCSAKDVKVYDVLCHDNLLLTRQAVCELEHLAII